MLSFNSFASISVKMAVRFADFTGRALTLYPVKPDSLVAVRQELKLWASEGMSGYAGIGGSNVAAGTLMKGTPPGAQTPFAHCQSNACPRPHPLDKVKPSEGKGFMRLKKIFLKGAFISNSFFEVQKVLEFRFVQSDDHYLAISQKTER